MTKSRTTCRCLVRKYKKGTHCLEFEDVFVLMKCPCPAFPGKSPCKPRKPRKGKGRHRRRKKKRFVRQVRYREFLEPGANTPVVVGNFGSWRYGPSTVMSEARPWYDPTAYRGKRMWDETHPPLRLRPKWYRISATGIHANPENSDFGGPMRLLSSNVPWHLVDGNLHLSQGDPGFEVTYDGGFVPTWFGNHPDPPPYADMVTLDPDKSHGSAEQYGAEAFKKMTPSLMGPADIPAILYELQDLPEQLSTSAHGFAQAWKAIGGRGGGSLMYPKSVADHYINHQFGWAPFLSDMFNTYASAEGLKNAIEKQRASNGHWLRRRRTLRNVQLSNIEVASDHYAYVRPDLGSFTRWDLAPDGVETRGFSHFTHESELKVWSVGQFRYWIPSLIHDDYSNYAKVMNRIRLLGLRVNPALIVKLSPWSWLGDWLTGNSMSQLAEAMLNPNDQVVARYAYVMCYLAKRTMHWATVFLQGNPQTAHGFWTARYESKVRSRASPFGFGLSSVDLNAKQLSILAALGISRAF